MKTRKIIAFLLALSGVFSLCAYEIAVSDSIWELSALICFIGAGRLFLFYEGTSLNEIDPAKAKVAFWLSILTTLSFCGYVIGLYYAGTVDWRGVLIFLLGTFVLAATEWVLSVRIGEEANSIVLQWRRKSEQLEGENGNLQKQLNNHHHRITSLESELNGERAGAKNMQQQITELQNKSEKGGNLLNSAIAPQRIAGRWVLPCPECRAAGRWNLLAANSNAAKSLTCQEHGLVWEESEHIHLAPITVSS